MPMTSPCVSVLMLAYNRPQFMRQAIESVLNQTFQDFEFFILDNASDNRVIFDIAKEYADKDARVHVSRVTDNLGVHLGRNKLLHQAGADYVATIEDDDFWQPDKLQVQVDFMQKNPHIGVYSCSYITVNIDGVPIGENICHESIHLPTQAIEGMGNYFKNFLGSGQIFSRTALLAVGGWRQYFITADDFDLFFRLQENFSYAATSKKLLNKREGDKRRVIGKGNYEKLGSHPMGTPYVVAASVSAYHRRNNESDPIERNATVDDLMMNNLPSLLNTLNDNWWGDKLLRNTAKFMLKNRDYAHLNQFIKNCYPMPMKKVIKLYVKLWFWSLRYMRVGWWWTR